jgi:hypothetical protein
MYKQHLLNNIEKEINICRRLYTKIPADQMNFRPKEGIRSILELLQYLSVIGSVMPAYWLKEDDGDFNSFFGNMAAKPKNMKHEDFLAVTTEQISLIRTLFDKITEEDLIKKEVTYPWGGKAPMGEAIMATSVKWLAAYKLQLLLFIKLCSDQKLGTGDAWVLTEIE